MRLGGGIGWGAHTHLLATDEAQHDEAMEGYGPFPTAEVQLAQNCVSHQRLEKHTKGQTIVIILCGVARSGKTQLFDVDVDRYWPGLGEERARWIECIEIDVRGRFNVEHELSGPLHELGLLEQAGGASPKHGDQIFQGSSAESSQLHLAVRDACRVVLHVFV